MSRTRIHNLLITKKDSKLLKNLKIRSHKHIVLGYIVKNSKLISILIKELEKKNNVNLITGSKLNSISYNNSNTVDDWKGIGYIHPFICFRNIIQAWI